VNIDDMLTNPTFISIVTILIRSIMLGASADYWFIGYSVLYLLIMVFIFKLVVHKYYPPFDKIPSNQRNKTNIIKTP
jgi:hypothetical protein